LLFDDKITQRFRNYKTERKYPASTFCLQTKSRGQCLLRNVLTTLSGCHLLRFIFGCLFLRAECLLSTEWRSRILETEVKVCTLKLNKND